MTDDHLAPRAVFPTSMLTGALILSLAIVIVLGVFVFGMGGHGTIDNATPPATQQKR